MDINKIPQKLHHLIPYATTWGIGDDAERDIKVESSSTEELKALVHSIHEDDADVLDNWLAGPEATAPPFSEEYISFTCFLMACDYARVLLKSRASKSPNW